MESRKRAQNQEVRMQEHKKRTKNDKTWEIEKKVSDNHKHI